MPFFLALDLVLVLLAGLSFLDIGDLETFGLLVSIFFLAELLEARAGDFKLLLLEEVDDGVLVDLLGVSFLEIGDRKTFGLGLLTFFLRPDLDDEVDRAGLDSDGLFLKFLFLLFSNSTVAARVLRLGSSGLLNTLLSAIFLFAIRIFFFLDLETFSSLSLSEIMSLSCESEPTIVDSEERIIESLFWEDFSDAVKNESSVSVDDIMFFLGEFTISLEDSLESSTTLSSKTSFSCEVVVVSDGVSGITFGDKFSLGNGNFSSGTLFLGDSAKDSLSSASPNTSSSIGSFFLNKHSRCYWKM